MLHVVVDDEHILTTFCGAHTMCAITGLSTKKLYDRIGGWFSSTDRAHFLRSMYGLGWESTLNHFSPFHTVSALHDFHAVQKDQERPFAIFISDHVFAYSQGAVSDTLTGIYPISFNKWVKILKRKEMIDRYKKVEGWYGFSPKKTIEQKLAEAAGASSWELEVEGYREGEKWNGDREEGNNMFSIQRRMR